MTTIRAPLTKEMRDRLIADSKDLFAAAARKGCTLDRRRLVRPAWLLNTSNWGVGCTTWCARLVKAAALRKEAQSDGTGLIAKAFKTHGWELIAKEHQHA